MSLAPGGSLIPKTVIASEINFSDQVLENSVAVPKGPQSINVTKYKPTSVNATSADGEVSFHIFTSSRSSVAMNRNVHVSYVLEATVTANAGLDNTDYLQSLFPTKLAPNSYPLASALNNVTVDIDGTSYTLNMDQWYQYAKYLWHSEDSAKSYDTLAPVLLDNKPFFEPNTGNVLAGMSEQSYDTIPPRGAYGPYQVRSVLGATGARQQSITLRYKMVECIPVSPMGTTNMPGSSATNSGFIGFSNMKLKLGFSASETTMFSRCMKLNPFTTGTTTYTMTSTDTGAVALTEPAFTFSTLAASGGGLQNITVSCKLTDFECITTFNTLSPIQSVPPVVSYSYNNIVAHTEDGLDPIPALTTAAGPGANPLTFITPGSKEIVSQNYQLSGMPHKIFIGCVPRVTANGYVVNNAGVIAPSYSFGSFFFPIYKITAVLGNTSGICSSFSPEQLYLRSVRNGLRWISYPQSGVSGSLLPSTTGGRYEVPLGYPLVLSTMYDIYSTDPTVSAGVAQNTSFQFTVNAYNYLRAAAPYRLIVLFIYEGVLTIGANSSFSYCFLTRDDVLNADQNAVIDLNDLHNPTEYAGGSMWSALKKYGKKSLKFVKSKQFRDALGQILDTGADLGVPGVSQAARIAEKGLGVIDAASGSGGRLLESRSGGSYIAGGQVLSAAALRRRLVK